MQVEISEMKLAYGRIIYRNLPLGLGLKPKYFESKFIAKRGADIGLLLVG